MQYAKQVSDITLKQKGAYDDSIRLNRKQKRKAKAGNTIKMYSNHFIERKRLEKREKLHVKEQQLKSQITSKVQALHESTSLLIENGLPKSYN